jgi:K+/H+ antiporter YhaU regulatory subunit KhtT
LKSVIVADASEATGKLIRELQLRSKCGASIVGIERSGASIINPGPDEELRAGDHILLLGTEDQLKAAELLLKG